MLRSALNLLTRLHSREALLKRLGSVDIFSPCRITPSNYHRFLSGPEYTTIKGSEFVVPIDSVIGQFAQNLSFDNLPDAGTFKIKFGDNPSEELSFSSTAQDIQEALRLITPLENVMVKGDFISGFKFVFVGFQVAPALGTVVDSTLENGGSPVLDTWKNSTEDWEFPIKRGDRILEGSKSWSVDEVIEMHDVGAQVMAYRVRVD